MKKLENHWRSRCIQRDCHGSGAILAAFDFSRNQARQADGNADRPMKQKVLQGRHQPSKQSDACKNQIKLGPQGIGRFSEGQRVKKTHPSEIFVRKRGRAPGQEQARISSRKRAMERLPPFFYHAPRSSTLKSRNDVEELSVTVWGQKRGRSLLRDFPRVSGRARGESQEAVQSICAGAEAR